MTSVAYSVTFSQAITIMLYIGIGSKEKDCNYLSIKDISKKLSIPNPSIKRIVTMLKRDNLIKSKTGINGGLSLTKDMNNISLFEIFDSIEGRSPLFKLYNDFNINNFKNNQNKIRKWLSNEQKIFNIIKNKMSSSLKAISLKDILKGKF